MLAAEEEGKEDRVDLIELRGLIFISEINMFLHMGEQENGTELQEADSVSAETASDALFIQMLFRETTNVSYKDVQS